MRYCFLILKVAIWDLDFTASNLRLSSLRLCALPKFKSRKCSLPLAFQRAYSFTSASEWAGLPFIQLFSSDHLFSDYLSFWCAMSIEIWKEILLVIFLCFCLSAISFTSIAIELGFIILEIDRGIWLAIISPQLAIFPKSIFPILEIHSLCVIRSSLSELLSIASLIFRRFGTRVSGISLLRLRSLLINSRINSRSFYDS